MSLRAEWPQGEKNVIVIKTKQKVVVVKVGHGQGKEQKIFNRIDIDYFPGLNYIYLYFFDKADEDGDVKYEWFLSIELAKWLIDQYRKLKDKPRGSCGKPDVFGNTCFWVVKTGQCFWFKRMAGWSSDHGDFFISEEETPQFIEALEAAANGE